MIDLAAFALALQIGDSAFPTGAFTASWGIEGMCAAGLVIDATSLERAVRVQIEHRWATCDRWFVSAGFEARTDRVRLAELDDLCEATMIAPAARLASRRAGSGTLSAHRWINVSGDDATVGWIESVQGRISNGELRGHLSVMWGALAGALGLDVDVAVVTSGVQFAQSLTSAALRLGVVGHLDAQRALTHGRECVVKLCATTMASDPSSNVPDADIAMLVHPQREHRLFSC